MCKYNYVKAVESHRTLTGAGGGECVHLVTRGHFRSHDKDGDNNIRSAIFKNPILHANLVALSYGTVVTECFKDDNASQLESGKFDPHSLKNP